MRHGPAVDEHVARVEPADDGKQIAQRFGVRGVKGRAVARLVAVPHQAVSREPRARSTARACSSPANGGNTSVIENGPGGVPNSAAWRSGSSAASSSALGSSARSAYGQNRSRG